MRLSRRLATIAAALALALTTAGVAGTAEARPRPPKPKELQLQVLSFNDFHGHLQPPGGTDATLGTTLDPTNTQVEGRGVPRVDPGGAPRQCPLLADRGRR